jgi:bifunctional non-homologous end joining protein LigD
MRGWFELRERDMNGNSFELRVGAGGEVRTWSISKGPSMDPTVRRTAVSTPESLDFGQTKVCDRGEFLSVLEFQRSWEKGWIVFTLNGKRLKGQFMLERSGRNYFNWSLYKLNDEFACTGEEIPAPIETDEESWSSLPLFAASTVNLELVR